METIIKKYHIYKNYAKELIKLSAPIMAGNIANMLINVGDVIVAGRHSTLTLGAISVASAIFMTFMIAAVGLMSSISPVVSNLRGERKTTKTLFRTTVKYSLTIGLIFCILIQFVIGQIHYIGLTQDLYPLVVEYLYISSWGMFGGLLFIALKEFLQAYEIVNFPNMITVVQIFLNLFLNVVLVFMLAFIIVCTLPIPLAILSCSCLMFMHIIFSIFMFANKIAVNLVMPEVFILFAIGCAYSYRYLNEGRKKEKIQSAMSKYLSKDVMKNVVDNIDSVKLGGKRANVTVLFADIRGFTSISERLSAEEVTKILNEYFTAIVPIIEKHNGILNKFMGDAVLAVFGEPIKNEHHALDAILCADAMLKKVKHLQEKWLEEGKPKIEIGIGISTGEAFVGNIGSEERLEYTVIGDTVNTASRIENYNKVYRTKFLISQETFEQVQKHVDVIKIREVSIRGKAKKINIYEVLRLLNV